jgi:hypothetical protein
LLERVAEKPLAETFGEE